MAEYIEIKLKDGIAHKSMTGPDGMNYSFNAGTVYKMEKEKAEFFLKTGLFEEVGVKKETKQVKSRKGRRKKEEVKMEEEVMEVKEEVVEEAEEEVPEESEE